MRAFVAGIAGFVFLSTVSAFAQDMTATPPNAAVPSTPDAATTDNPPPAVTAAPPPAAAPAPQNPPMTGPQILVQTSMGDITLQLDSVRAPKTVANVLRYVRERHYNGTAIYRVVKGFVIEMGSWDAKGKGRPVHKGVVLESDNGLSNLRGTVALAHGDDPNSGTADFFINLADNVPLDRGKGDGDKLGFAVFGQVSQGMDVVDRIAAVPVGGGVGPMPDQEPVEPILIKTVSIVGEPDRPPRKSPKKK